MSPSQLYSLPWPNENKPPWLCGCCSVTEVKYSDWVRRHSESNDLLKEVAPLFAKYRFHGQDVVHVADCGDKDCQHNGKMHIHVGTFRPMWPLQCQGHADGGQCDICRWLETSQGRGKIFEFCSKSVSSPLVERRRKLLSGRTTPRDAIPKLQTRTSYLSSPQKAIQKIASDLRQEHQQNVQNMQGAFDKTSEATALEHERAMVQMEKDYEHKCSSLSKIHEADLLKVSMEFTEERCMIVRSCSADMEQHALQSEEKHTATARRHQAKIENLQLECEQRLDTLTQQQQGAMQEEAEKYEVQRDADALRLQTESQEEKQRHEVQRDADALRLQNEIQLEMQQAVQNCESRRDAESEQHQSELQEAQEHIKELESDVKLLTLRMLDAATNADAQPHGTHPVLSRVASLLERGMFGVGDLCLLNQMCNKVDPSTQNTKTRPEIEDLTLLLMNKLSKQDYTTVASIMHLPTFRWAQLLKAKSLLRFTLGINHDVLSATGTSRFMDEWVLSCGDGSRTTRLIERLGDRMVGAAYPPDVCDWPEEWAPHVPKEAKDALKYIRYVHQNNLLSHEMHTELLRCVTNPTVPILVYVLFPEPSKGFDGYRHLKYMYKMVSVWHQHRINCVGFCTDSCSTGLSGGTTLMTPSAEGVSAGFSYIGLECEPDFEYFGVYMRPAYTYEICEAAHATGLFGGCSKRLLQTVVGFLEDSADYRAMYQMRMVSRAFYHAIPELPLPILWYGDNPHLVRTARRNMTNWRVDLVFLDTLIEGIGRIVTASFAKLQSIADTITLDKGYRLSDILDVNSWRDQKTDASYYLFSLQTIELLLRHAPEDTGTILYMYAIYHIAEVFLNKKFTNPAKIVEYAWTAHAILVTQEIYVKKCAKLERDADCYLPSYQMRRTVKAMAHAATVHVLRFFRHRKGKEWSEGGLGSVNQNPVEALHSDGRCGQVLRNNDRNYTGKKWLEIISKLQMIGEKKIAVNAVQGWRCGEARNAEGSQSGKITSLGLLGDDILLREIDGQKVLPRGKASDFEANASEIPATYDTCVPYIVMQKRKGQERGLAFWEKLLPVAVAQMKQKKVWPADAGWPKRTTALPEGAIVASGPVCNTRGPLHCKDPDTLIVPLKVQREMEKQQALLEAELSEIQEDSGDGERDTEEGDATLTAVNELLHKAKEDASVAADGKKKPKVWGLHLEHEEERVNTDKFLSAEQDKERVSNDRWKRFIIMVLRGRGGVLKPGHDITRGTCVIVSGSSLFRDVKGTGRMMYAVARILKIAEGNEQVHSCDSTKISDEHSFKCELLVPIGEPTPAGAQCFGPSGFSLPWLRGKHIKQRVELLRIPR